MLASAAKVEIELLEYVFFKPLGVHLFHLFNQLPNLILIILFEIGKLYLKLVVGGKYIHFEHVSQFVRLNTGAA